jgi:hypothetical protein
MINKIILFIAYSSFNLFANELYIYKITNNCQSIFPGNPYIGVFGSYMYKDNDIRYQGVESKFPGSFPIRDIKKNKDKWDNMYKKVITKMGMTILYFDSKIKNNQYIIEYKVKNNIFGVKNSTYECIIEIFQGKKSCKWVVSTETKNNIKEINSIFTNYKHNIKLKL